MMLNLAVRATVDSDKVPSLPPEAEALLKDALGSPIALGLAFIGIAAFLWNVGGRKTRSVLLALGTLLGLGWLDRSGVAVAAATSMGGTEEDAVLAMAAVVVVGGLWLVFAGPPKKKKASPLDALKDAIPGLSSSPPSRRRRRR
jgi:hypothetical protein